MELDRESLNGSQPPEDGNQPQGAGPGRRRALTLAMNGVIVCGLLSLGYFTYVSRGAGAPDLPKELPKAKSARLLQIDVLNGCGAKGAAARFTTFLRGAGFDVVEMKNYKVSGVPRTLVVDRVGDLEAARRVASALGVSGKNVIQQLNPDYFVDVSVILGADYASLQPSH